MARKKKKKRWVQATIDEILAEASAEDREEQTENLERVSKRIGAHVIAFCRSTLANGGEFHAEELRRYVSARILVAPGSVDRILRDLRQNGELSYKVASRRASLYQVTGVTERRN